MLAQNAAVEAELYSRIRGLEAELDHRIPPQLQSILDVSIYTDIREGAYDFLEDQIKSVSSMRYAFQRYLLEGTLNYFLRDVEERGTHSFVYTQFMAFFTDDQFPRQQDP